MKTLSLRFCALFVLCLTFSAPSYAVDIEQYFEGLGKIYWDSEEDLTQEFDLEDVVPKNYYESSFTPALSAMLPDAIQPNKKGRPVIAIIIDDMGVNRKMSSYTMDNIVSNKVTMAYLPYGRKMQEQVDHAVKRGHEIILHLPWEANRDTVDAGPNHLSTKDSKEEIHKKLLENLSKFEGYVGVNNHMGSGFSVHREGLEIVMEELAERDVFFLDSVTTMDTLAEKVAREYSIPTTHRNVFLDHKRTPEYVANALQEVERIARKEGSAIAIGHPKKITVDALNEWIPTLEEKGFTLVTLSEVVGKRQNVYNAQVTQLKKNGHRKN